MGPVTRHDMDRTHANHPLQQPLLKAHVVHVDHLDAIRLAAQNAGAVQKPLRSQLVRDTHLAKHHATAERDPEDQDRSERYEPKHARRNQQHRDRDQHNGCQHGQDPTADHAVGRVAALPQDSFDVVVVVVRPTGSHLPCEIGRGGRAPRLVFCRAPTARFPTTSVFTAQILAALVTERRLLRDIHAARWTFHS